MYSNMTRKTSRKVIIKGKRRRPIVSLRIKVKSVAPFEFWSRTADTSSTGNINSSAVMIIRKMHPNTARVL